MTYISNLRTLVNNGWTIANRRNIVSQIGKTDFDEISSLAGNANLKSTLDFSKAFEWLKPENLEKTKQTLKSIIDSYKTYAQSPFVNDYLRKGSELSESASKIVESLKLAINNGSVSGKFIRGLSPNRANKLENIDDVAKFIFENKGFTSVVPEANADYANCFALGKNGAKVIFDIKNMPGYKAGSYEVLFDTDAFTRENFNIEQIGEKIYKVTQK